MNVVFSLKLRGDQVHKSSDFIQTIISRLSRRYTSVTLTQCKKRNNCSNRTLGIMDDVVGVLISGYFIGPIHFKPG